MCGIFGLFGARPFPDRPACERALARIAHRGPDALGLVHRPDDGLCLGHARLSILDLDARSDQPFRGPDCTLVYNGEVFNFRELRAELERDGEVFTTSGDTEVIARGWRRHGDAFFDRLRGMFALALYDERERVLHLARDEFGIKPLLLLERDGAVWFASEVKPIAALQPLGIDPGVLVDALQWGFPLEDRSLYADVQFLPPGTVRTYRKHGAGSLQSRSRVLYRKAAAFAATGPAPDAAALRATVERAVADHMLADVPVAVALSGGLDSSIVTVAAARHAADLHAHTFTLAAAGDPEVEHATLLSRHLGLTHYIAHLDHGAVGEWLRAVAWHLEEPIANVNALPGFALAAAVHAAGCKVVLVGEGSDELFGGYPWQRLAMVPGAERDPGAVFDAYRQRRAQRALLPCLRPEVQKLAEERLRRQRDDYVQSAAGAPTGLAAFQSFDLDTQLQYSQLLRVDRMFMAHGVEARVPFLYRSVLEASALLRPEQKLLPAEGDGRRDKVALAAAFATALPERITHRPKFGAAGTVDLWSTWLGAGLVAVFDRCLHSAELAAARSRLSPLLDWATVARSNLAPKDRFTLALLLEATEGVLSGRDRPDAMPSLPLRVLRGPRHGNPT
ncbi:MAG: asparagine synthase (glutamine-hydrolyzing) [Planctomycetes bacterium]|nr:asparagine synthase (glutamine-hydrolyzing) [Planctomycetota bacterium]